MSISGSYLPNIVTSLVGKWEGHIEAGSQRLKYALEVQDISEQQKGHITYKGTHESGNRTGVSVTVEWDCMTEVVIRDAEALIEGKLDVLRGTMEGAVRAQATMEVFGKFHLQLIPSNGSNNVMAHVPAMQTSTARISESVRMRNTTASHLRASVSTPRGSMSASRNRVSHGNREGGEILYTMRGSKTYASASEQERVTSREAARRKFFDAERKYVASSARTTKPLHSRNSNATGRPIRESSGRPPSIAPQSSTPRKFNQDPRGGSVTSAVPSHLMTPRGRSATPSTTRAAVHHRNTIETHYQLRSTTERFQTPKKHEPESALREWVDPRDIAARAAPRNSPAKTSFGGTTPRFFSPGAARAAAMGSSRPDTNNPARYEFVDPRDIAYSLKPINQRVVALPHRSSTRPGILSTGCL